MQSFEYECRWHNHLNPDIRKDIWSQEEDRIILAAHIKYGNRWAEIAKLLPGRQVLLVAHFVHRLHRARRACAVSFGLVVSPHTTFFHALTPSVLSFPGAVTILSSGVCRTDNAIKNHWNSTMRRKFASEIAGAEAAAGSQSKSASTKRAVPKKRTLRAESLNRVKSSYSEFHDTVRVCCAALIKEEKRTIVNPQTPDVCGLRQPTHRSTAWVGSEPGIANATVLRTGSRSTEEPSEPEHMQASLLAPNTRMTTGKASSVRFEVLWCHRESDMGVTALM